MVIKKGFIVIKVFSWVILLVNLVFSGWCVIV